MSDFMSMQPSNNSFQELIGNGVKYLIPKFQRDYSWNQEQWEELWDDINGLAEESYHYMGYVVLQRKEDNLFEVIDGQQRLVTLSVVVLAAMSQLQRLIDAGNEVESNATRIELIKEKYIGFQNSVTLSMNNKLTLNRNNAQYFKNLSAKLMPANNRGITQTNKLIRNGFNYFVKQSMGTTGEEIAQKIEDLSTGMVFTKIVVNGDVNAYKVFETLNARGVQLSTPDLLKNYIFSVVTQDDVMTEDELTDLDEIWGQILTNLGESHFTDFVRYHHNFQHKLVTKKNLFSAVKRNIPTPEQGVNYLHSLSKFSSIYAALLNPYDSWWAEQGTDYREVKLHLEGLNLFNIKQPNTLLMIAFDKFSANEFVKLVRYIYVLSIRYNVVCHFSPNEQEKVYNQMAMKINNGEYVRASHIKNDSELFGRLYPDDEQFKSAFEFHRMPSRQSAKKIRFLLADIESYLGHAVNRDRVTLEHVCPYHPNQVWQEQFGDGVADVYDRLGNMVLLERDELSRIGFIEKKQVYQDSPFRLARKVAEFEEWNLENVNHYQHWLAEKALQTWRVDS